MGVIVESIQAGDGKHYRESPAHAAFRPLSVAGRERNSGCSEGERRRVEKGERYALEICCCSESAGQKQSKGGNEGGRERQYHPHATLFPLCQPRSPSFPWAPGPKLFPSHHRTNPLQPTKLRGCKGKQPRCTMRDPKSYTTAMKRQTVTVHYVGYLDRQSEKMFDSTFNRGV
jgi:hypothetical protein